MLYNALSVGKKTPKIARSPWDCITPAEEDRATVIGNMHKTLVNIMHVVQEICPRTDRHTHTCSLQYFATARAGEVVFFLQ